MVLCCYQSSSAQLRIMIPDNNHPAFLLALFSFFPFTLCPMLCKGAVCFLLARHAATLRSVSATTVSDSPATFPVRYR